MDCCIVNAFTMVWKDLALRATIITGLSPGHHGEILSLGVAKSGPALRSVRPIGCCTPFIGFDRHRWASIWVVVLFHHGDWEAILADSEVGHGASAPQKHHRGHSGILYTANS